ncbi:MAG: sigma factor-like helix-turn-helix DNA-binding protein [Planctomycetota bacterium]
MAAASELARVAAAAFRSLGEDDRQVLRLVREEGVTLAGAADRMGRSYEATKKLYARALARFRASFDRRRGDSDDER